MSNTQTLIVRAYSAFNHRNIDSALALMSENVSWPKALEEVHQLVKSLGGDVLSDSEVWHVYKIANGLIERMDLNESETSSDSTPSPAFSGH